MTLTSWYDKGLTPEQYIATLDKHKDAFTQIHKEFQLPQDDPFFTSLQEKNLRAVVLAEPWCGHCMLTVPVFLHLAEQVNMPVRFLLRDENLALMDQYLTNGKSRSIPIYIFIDAEGNEVAKWGPIAAYTKEESDKLRVNLPDKEDPAYQDAFKDFITVLTDKFRNDPTFWNGTYESMKQKLQV